GTPGRWGETEDGRRFPGRTRTRDAARRGHGPGHRPSLHDAPRPGKHSRCHSLPAVEAQAIVVARASRPSLEGGHSPINCTRLKACKVPVPKGLLRLAQRFNVGWSVLYCLSPERDG